MQIQSSKSKARSGGVSYRMGDQFDRAVVAHCVLYSLFSVEFILVCYRLWRILWNLEKSFRLSTWCVVSAASKRPDCSPRLTDWHYRLISWLSRLGMAWSCMLFVARDYWRKLSLRVTQIIYRLVWTKKHWKGYCSLLEYSGTSQFSKNYV